MKNRKIVEKLDPLGSLPDEILHNIFSHLNVKEVVQSSILSKRWRTLWVYQPNINIEDRMWPSLSPLREMTFLTTFVSCFLCLREHRIDKFHVSCSSYEDDKNVNYWINYYVSVLAQEITIENMPKLLPESLHSYRVAKTVKLSSVVLRPAYFGKLNFRYGKCMENLIIKDCPHFDIEHFSVHAPGLKKFVVENNHIIPTDVANIESCVFQLTGVLNPITVEFKGYMYKDYLFEEDTPTLLAAHLDMKITTTRINEVGVGLEKCLRNVLRGLSNTKSLTISAESPQGGCWKWEQMQTFCHCMFFKLKLAEIQFVQECDDNLKFLQLLMTNADCLENIQSLSKVNQNEIKLIEFGRKLQWIPKASSSLKIQVLSKRELDRESPLVCQKIPTDAH